MNAGLPVKQSAKPLNGKAYGSIPHLPSSRLGPGDHHCAPGQETICTVKARDKHDRIIVTEKLDGSNVAVAKVNGEILALTRAGYLANTSPHRQHHMFNDWVNDNRGRFDRILDEGMRINGEWLALAHGTRYQLPHEPFVCFDMMNGSKRMMWDTITGLCKVEGITTARVLSDGKPISLADVLPMIETSGHGAMEAVEGAVWRVERKGEFDFNAKWVRPDKQDGKYFKEVHGEDVWNESIA